MVTDGRGDDSHPDRAAWSGYWRAIRTAAVWLLVAVVIVGGGALLPRPDGFLPRIAMESLIGLAVAVLATYLARHLNAWWEARHA